MTEFGSDLDGVLQELRDLRDDPDAFVLDVEYASLLVAECVPLCITSWT